MIVNSLLLFCFLCARCIVAEATVGGCLVPSKIYDFIVIGGGTAGLAFASRLSQRRPEDQIVVLEAGLDGRDDPRIYIPWNKGTALGTELDWNFTTVQQPNLLDRVLPQNRGKVLGGSSAINLIVWDRATETEFDSWETLGNSGWGWNSIHPYQLMAENFLRNASTYGDTDFGSSGPIGTSISQYISPQAAAFFPAIKSLGIPLNEASLNGSSIGVSYQPSSVNGMTHQRSYSVEYLKLASSNLCVMADTRVEKIQFEMGELAIATGVLLENGVQLLASKEVVISAGVLQSPGILELSGIGNSSILNELGIDLVQDLPGVGENLQDHLRITNSYQVRSGVLSSDELRSNATYRMEQLELYNSSLPSIYWGSRNGFAFLTWDQVQGADADNLAKHAVRGTESKKSAVLGEKLQYITNSSASDVPNLEIFISDGYSGRKGYPSDNSSVAYDDGFFSLFAALQQPLSLGSVHITSKNVSIQPAIDPHYFSSSYDLEALVTAGKYLRRIASTSPLNEYWVSEYEPGVEVQTQEEWKSHVLNSTFSIYHPAGTCAMLPREHAGVVDPKLKVYGVQNLRVVDASIMPLLVSAHIQTAVYGIAEKAASMVAADWMDS